ncbi:hypothetical protein QFC21_000489 [Naganishia friedmannii]|uniref:Uncharacterized protein n=1 Tax=Naganishia friedmannii TaxID=89922 RepID=A0ACC2WCN5_9TREE|nr:hypothetical protein QFC21_000489 [Naganishia friedmannii]
MLEPQSLQSEDTVYSADSIEFSPVQQDVFVCGTYQIQKVEEAKVSEVSQAGSATDAQTGEPVAADDSSDEDANPAPRTTRLGRALVYKVAEDGQSFKETQRFDGPAILDMKWLAIANAEGQIALHAWNMQTLERGLAVFIYSNNWSTGKLSKSKTQKPYDTGELIVEQAWESHDYEPWITAFDLWRPDVVWSGGDDLKLKQWDLRSPYSPISVNKTFEGGVTTIAPNPHVEHLVAVGSYDEHIRLFDARNIKQPLRKVHVGGGVWRTKWHPDASRKSDVLLACMHGGFNIVNVGDVLTAIDACAHWSAGEDEGCTITTRFDKHESIAYGVDWSTSQVHSLVGDDWWELEFNSGSISKL